MRTAIHLVTAAILLILGQATQAKGDGDLWVMMVGPMCLSQFPQYADTELGKIFLRGSEINAFIERPFAQCFKVHGWASKQLCAELMGIKRESIRDIQSVYEHHRDEISGMNVAFNYFDAYIAADPSSPNWPHKCPEVSK